MQLRVALLALATAAASAFSRTREPFDSAWQFHLGDLGFGPSCNASAFTINYTNIQCMQQNPNPAQTQAACENACACDPTCNVWQWCPTGNCGLGGHGCWLGSNVSACTGKGDGWVSFARVPPTPGPPAPVPPCLDPAAPCAPSFPDSSWRTVDTPHDFVVEGAPVPTADRGHGYLPFNISWYRRHFQVDPSLQGAAIWLEFDGVYRNSDVWLNGVHIAHQNSGYVPFIAYIHNATLPDGVTPALKYGADNVLAVRADALVWRAAQPALYATFYTLASLLHTLTPPNPNPNASGKLLKRVGFMRAAASHATFFLTLLTPSSSCPGLTSSPPSSRAPWPLGRWAPWARRPRPARW